MGLFCINKFWIYPVASWFQNFPNLPRKWAKLILWLIQTFNFLFFKIVLRSLSHRTEHPSPILFHHYSILLPVWKSSFHRGRWYGKFNKHLIGNSKVLPYLLHNKKLLSNSRNRKHFLLVPLAKENSRVHLVEQIQLIIVDFYAFGLLNIRFSLCFTSVHHLKQAKVWGFYVWSQWLRNLKGVHLEP